MTVLEKIQSDLKEALLAKDTAKVSALRLVIAAASNERIAKGQDLTDEDLTKLVQREVKQHDESIEAAKRVGREDLVAQNEAEKKALLPYLPEQLDSAKIEEVVVSTIHEIGASSPSDMGKVMAAVMPKLRGQADGATVSRIVSQHLGS